MGRMRKTHALSVVQHEGTRQVQNCDVCGRRSKWILKKRGEGLALVDTVMRLRVTQKAKNFVTSSATTSFLRRRVLHGVSQLGYS
jgi:hypothetical protein